MRPLSEVIQILSRMKRGDAQAAGRLLPLVYDGLRKLAAQRLSRETPAHTLQATALVHEAYLRLVGEQRFDGREHFFAAAVEAMRPILVDAARRKRMHKHGGGRRRVELPDVPAQPDEDEQLLALDEALARLADEDPVAARVVELRHFGGLSIEETADYLHVAPATVKRHWAFARAWLFRRLSGDGHGV